VKLTTARLLLLLALAASLPRPARAFSAVASAGFGYLRETNEPDVGPKAVSPSFALDLRLDARGWFEREGLFDWRLAAGYRRTTANSFTSDSTLRSFLSYSGQLAFNGVGRGPLTVRVFANRLEQKYSASAVGTPIFGTATSTSAGVDTTLRLPGKQTLMLGYSRTSSSDEIPGLPTHDSTSQTINAGLYMPLEGGSLAANYQGGFGSGLWVSDQVQSHAGTVAANAEIANHVYFGLNEVFVVLLPGTAAAGAFRAEQSDFRAQLTNGRIGGSAMAFEYGNTRTLIDPNGGPYAEATRQFLHGSTDVLLYGSQPVEWLSAGMDVASDNRVYLQFSADASYGRALTPTLKSQAWGETFGGEAYWAWFRAQNLVQLHAGPFFGWTQPDVGPSTTGWGLTAGALYNRPLDVFMFSGEYNLSYTDRIFASDSTQLTQGLRASIGGPIGTVKCSLSARAAVTKQSSAVFGDGASRYLTLTAGASQHSLSANLAVTVSDGILPGMTPRSISGDGLFIPAPYDTQTRDLSARVAWNLAQALSVTAEIRRTSSDVPGQPTINQTAANGGITYAFAGFYSSLTYGVTWFEANAGGKVSTLMFRISRDLAFRTW
jgi:hypothetical protein